MMKQIFPNFLSSKSYKIEPNLSAISPLEIFLNIGYKFRFLPYRFKWEPIYGKYILKTNLSHKIPSVFYFFIGLFMHIAGLSFQIGWFLFYSSKSGTEYFQVIAFTLAFGRIIYCSGLIWLGRKRFENLFNCFKYGNYANFKKSSIFVLFILFLELLIPQILTLFGEMFRTDFSIEKMMALPEIDQGNYVNLQNFLNSNEKIYLKIGLYILSKILTLYLSSILYISEILFFLLLIVYSNVLEEFIEQIENLGDPKKILTLYFDKSKIVHSINELGSVIMFSSSYMTFAHLLITIYSILALATHQSEKLYDFWNYFSFLVSFIVLVALLKTSKRLKNTKDCLKYWLFDLGNYKAIDEKDLSILLNEISGDSLGLSCAGFFVISYGAIGSILGVIFSYLLIVIQFNASTSNCSTNYA